MLEAGHVRAGGKTLKPGEKFAPGIELEIAGREQQARETFAVYKPRGVICSKDTDGGRTVFSVFPKLRHLNSVGRLDKESEGLLLLSNDGLVTKAITDSSHPSEKEYVVTVREDVMPWMITKFQKGLRIEGYTTLPAEAAKVDRHTFRITLREGKKHQIRRMANAVGLTITNLKRVRINDITLGHLRPGNARKLKPAEVEALKALVA